MDTVSLPPWLTLELAVSIATFVATIIGVVIAYRKLKPGLRVQVTRCTHVVRYMNPNRQEEPAGTEINIEFTIRNTGARTSIYNVGIKCKPIGQTYQTTEKVQSPQAIAINHGDTKIFSHQFYVPRRGIEDVSLNCAFYIYHSFGKKKVRTKSNYHGERESESA